MPTEAEGEAEGLDDVPVTPNGYRVSWVKVKNPNYWRRGMPMPRKHRRRSSRVAHPQGARFVVWLKRASRGSMDNRFVSIYLRDHHAASAGGVELARRALGQDHPLAQQIARDRKALEEVMRQLDVAPSAIKVGLVRVAELLGRLKLNGRVFRRSPLSRVLELEMLVVGIRGKEALWTSLLAADLSIRGIELDALVESAKEQGRAVEEQRVRAAASTFGERGG